MQVLGGREQSLDGRSADHSCRMRRRPAPRTEGPKAKNDKQTEDPGQPEISHDRCRAF